MTRAIRKSRQADRDLVGIWEYSRKQWNAHQADKYLDELNEGIRLLTDNPNMGAQRDYVRKGYRVLFVNHHAVYYIVKPSAIQIIRVLHEQMDPERRF